MNVEVSRSFREEKVTVPWVIMGTLLFRYTSSHLNTKVKPYISLDSARMEDYLGTLGANMGLIRGSLVENLPPPIA